MKTTDLERSKRLKELGWKQESEFYIGEHSGVCTAESYAEFQDWASSVGQPEGSSTERHYSAPTAGEMIEWLLGDKLNVDINFNRIDICEMNFCIESFSMKDGLCNALADAVIWVLERKNQ